jgi:hypothetical protein
MGSVMTHRSTVKRQLIHAIELTVMTCRRVGVAGPPSGRAVALAIVLGVAFARLISPDLQTFGSREALAAGLAVDRVRASGVLDSYAYPGSCDKDQVFQEAFSWDDLMAYFTGRQAVYRSASKIGYCIEKPRTTRPGVAGGNKWDYWDDYWARENHKNDSIWYGGW